MKKPDGMAEPDWYDSPENPGMEQYWNGEYWSKDLRMTNRNGLYLYPNDKKILHKSLFRLPLGSDNVFIAFVFIAVLSIFYSIKQDLDRGDAFPFWVYVLGSSVTVVTVYVLFLLILIPRRIIDKKIELKRKTTTDKLDKFGQTGRVEYFEKMTIDFKRINLNSKNLVILIISGVLALLVLNLAFSNYHLSQVLNSVEKTEEIMETHLDRERLFPTSNSNCYRSEIVGRVYCGSELNNWVTEKVLISAKNSYTDLSVEKYKLDRKSLLPFGSELNESVDAYRDHIDSWLDYYKTIGTCSDYACYYNENLKPKDISSSFRIAEEAFRSVIPLFDVLNSQARIDEVFKN
jgi:hypothetical protein